MMEKIENDAAAYARTLATNRGRNAKAAEEAVRKSSSYTEQEALKLGLIDFIAPARPRSSNSSMVARSGVSTARSRRFTSARSASSPWT